MTTTPATRPVIRCCYCWRTIFKARDLRWYHKWNASRSCKPGWGGNYASPGGAE